jgi:hypothetical protein
MVPESKKLRRRVQKTKIMVFTFLMKIDFHFLFGNYEDRTVKT